MKVPPRAGNSGGWPIWRIDMEQATTIDGDRLTVLFAAMKTAINCTPNHLPLEERIRLGLGGLPDRVVKEMGDTARAFAVLIEVHLGGVS